MKNNPMAQVHDENHEKTKNGVISDDFWVKEEPRHSETIPDER